jgi:hypothetical protein
VKAINVRMAHALFLLLLPVTAIIIVNVQLVEVTVEVRVIFSVITHNVLVFIHFILNAVPTLNAKVTSALQIIFVT